MEEAKPVFSDYAHMGTGLNDIVFAVQLRNDEPQEELLKRILPMSQITPGKIVERVIRSTGTAGHITSSFHPSLNHLSNFYFWFSGEVEDDSVCNKEGGGEDRAQQWTRRITPRR